VVHGRDEGRVAAVDASAEVDQAVVDRLLVEEAAELGVAGDAIILARVRT
jgi:regulator of RNase E activity RraA